MFDQTTQNNVEISTDRIDRKWIDVNIPCKAACPIMTDIPGYIQAIMEGDYQKAYRINRMDNVLPGVLGRVCHRPCETVCRHGWDGLGDPVSICFLKRSSSDFGFVDIKQEIIPNGKKACIIGAGPSGLTAANDLALRGYEVTMLEQFDEPGGMLRYGIPQFRLPYDIVARDVKSITDLGVEIETKARIDKDFDFDRLKKEYHAVVLAGGCMLPKRIKLSNDNASGFYWGLDFMMTANRENFAAPIGTAIVIGGGFTAVDCIRTAYRLGAKKVILAFRRTRDDMSVGEFEIEAMEAEGIEFAFLVTPVDIEAKDGKVTGVKLIRTSIEKDSSLKEISGSEFVTAADTVIFAIGQQEEKEILGAEKLDQIDNLFITGDFRNGASTVIEAAADGRRAARSVHKFLSGIKGYQDVIRIQKVETTNRIRDYDFIDRQPIDETPISERRDKNREVELGFSQEKALIEARRCYLCHYNFQIDISRCIYCLACIDVMPVDCIKMAKEIEIDDDGNLNYIAAAGWSDMQAIAIDNNKCIRCGNCVRACPVDCISISRYNLKTVEMKQRSE